MGFRRFPHGDMAKRAGIILDGPIVEKTRCFLRMGMRKVFMSKSKMEC